MAEPKLRRRAHGEDAIYFAASKNRYVGAVSLVVSASALVLRVFAVSGLDQVIPNFADLDEALQPAPAAPSRAAAAAAAAVQAGDAHPRRPAAGRSWRETQPGLTV